MEPVNEAFWRRIDMRAGATECWPFIGATSRFGYGRLKFRGKLMSAHRVAYMLAKGSIPPRLFVLHACDNPICCNPAHLRVGTPRDNVRDMISRGRKPESLLKGVDFSSAKIPPEIAAAVRAHGKCAIHTARDFGISQRAVRRIMGKKV